MSATSIPLDEDLGYDSYPYDKLPPAQKAQLNEIFEQVLMECKLPTDVETVDNVSRSFHTTMQEYARQ
jgi:hypothetical protein